MHRSNNRSSPYDATRLRDVACYLLLYFVHARELLLRPQALFEGNVDHLPVQIPFVVQQVGLDPALPPLEGGRDADVGTRPVTLLSYPYVPGVHPSPGNERDRTREYVGGGKA